MATYIKGSAVVNATSYELFEKKAGGEYVSLDEKPELNFEVSALDFEAGDHTLVVVAKAENYENSAYSNEVIYTAGGNGSTDDSSGEPTKSIQDYIVDPWACWSSGQESATSGYFSVVDYPVEEGATYAVPYGRNYFFEDSSKTYLSGGAGGGSRALQITIPANAVYMTVCFKPDDIATTDVTITKV